MIQQPIVRIDIETDIINTKKYIAVWEFTALRRWPKELISYNIEEELVLDDADETLISSKIIAKVKIVPDGLYIELPDGTEIVDNSVTTGTWAASEAGVAISGGISAIMNIILGG